MNVSFQNSIERLGMYTSRPHCDTIVETSLREQRRTEKAPMTSESGTKQSYKPVLLSQSTKQEPNRATNQFYCHSLRNRNQTELQTSFIVTVYETGTKQSYKPVPPVSVYET
ncbi:hypothetical protein BgiMline_002568 [Biomphalaria glabrata]